MRSYCAAQDHSSEYDWLTFLWALNAKNNTGQLSMPSLFNLFGDQSLRGTTAFLWSNIRALAASRFGPQSNEYLLIAAEAQKNGVNL